MQLSNLHKTNLAYFRSVLWKSAPFKLHSEKSTSWAIQSSKDTSSSSNELNTEKDISQDSKNIGAVKLKLLQFNEVQLTPVSLQFLKSVSINLDLVNFSKLRFEFLNSQSVNLHSKNWVSGKLQLTNLQPSKLLSRTISFLISNSSKTS